METKKVKKVAAKPKKVEPKPRIKVNAKLADPNSILEAYDRLINQLAKVESAQRAKNKPYRMYFIHRKRMEALKLNFVKSMR